MFDRRTNWKENISQEAQERTQAKLDLLDKLETLRGELKSCARDFERRDEVALQYRETVAKLATL